MRILVFLHGTVIMHSSAVGCTREETGPPVSGTRSLVANLGAYVPTEGAVAKLKA